ncbi:MAG: stage III sporulation protein AA [Acetatifactor sp.]
MQNISLMFPGPQRALWKKLESRQSELSEIRLRVNQPIRVVLAGKEYYLSDDGSVTLSENHAMRIGQDYIPQFLDYVCQYSLYAFEEEVRRGFLTTKGGNRIGIAGQVVLNEQSQIKTIKHIFYVNIRICHEVLGAADSILPHAYEKHQLKNILIISPPGWGKTTILRDLVRQVSDGNPYERGKNVALIDERSEIAGSFLGIAENHIGSRTDCLDGCPKTLGMMLMLRSMAPQVLAIDELGGFEELETLRQANACGCKVIATAHGCSIDEVERRFGGEVRGLFDLFVLPRRRENSFSLRITDREGVCFD